MKETHTIREEDMAGLAERVIDLLLVTETSAAKVVLLDGDLGAGKTTFTKELAWLLGIERDSVNRPTFILKKEYNTEHHKFKKLVHVDAYRFNHPKESKILRLVDDLVDPQTIICVEWPSKMNYLKSDVALTFLVVDDETREIGLEYEKDI